MQLRRKFAANIRRMREDRGWSQEELAERAGIHRTYLSMVERMTRNPTLDVLERIANALDAEPTDLLT